MSRFLLDLRASQVIQGIRVRQLRMKAMANAAANAIALTTNETLIPEVYPGRIAQTLQASADLPRANAQMAAVRLQATDPLWKIYEYGARPHPIYAVNGMALAFGWDRVSQEAMFNHVNHPGFGGRHRLSALEASIKEEASAQWYAALYEAIIARL